MSHIQKFQGGLGKRIMDYGIFRVGHLKKAVTSHSLREHNHDTQPFPQIVTVTTDSKFILNLNMAQAWSSF